MSLSKIYSLRGFKEAPFRDIVYEWEDKLSELMGLDVISLDEKWGKSCEVYNKYLRLKKFRKLNVSKPYGIAFVLGVYELVYIKRLNCFPIFLDLWNADFRFLLRNMGTKHPYAVTSLDVYEKIKRLQPKSKVYYLPLMISDSWVTNEVPQKEYDVIQMGRKNEVLHQFMLRYAKEHPGTEYVYSEQGKSDGNLHYVSTDGRNISDVVTRGDYKDMLCKAKISLVSSPGMDNSRKCAEDIDFPTPRFYECATQYSYMVGRYSDHKEFVVQGVDKVCPNIADYSQFEGVINKYISSDGFLLKKEYDEFIGTHVTSAWVSDLNAIIKELENR